MISLIITVIMIIVIKLIAITTAPVRRQQTTRAKAGRRPPEGLAPARSGRRGNRSAERTPGGKGRKHSAVEKERRGGKKAVRAWVSKRKDP